MCKDQVIASFFLSGRLCVYYHQTMCCVKCVYRDYDQESTLGDHMKNVKSISGVKGAKRWVHGCTSE